MNDTVSEILLHSIEHSAIDGLRLFPFLLVTYLILEYLEHKTNDKSLDLIRRSGKYGPFLGALLGIFPQCGFSTIASNFYAARVITLGTLIAVYLSTSDEMLPIMISMGVSVGVMLKILAIKFGIALVAGFLIDAVLRQSVSKKNEEMDIHLLCSHDDCHCHEESMFKSALRHSVQITLFVVVITFLFSLLMEFIGKDNLEAFLHDRPVLGEMAAGLVGLIPNCSSSAIITILYLENTINVGSMFSGLLVGAGMGILVLFRVNPRPWQNIRIMLLLYIIGVVSGVIINYLGISI